MPIVPVRHRQRLANKAVFGYVFSVSRQLLASLAAAGDSVERVQARTKSSLRRGFDTLPDFDTEGLKSSVCQPLVCVLAGIEKGFLPMYSTAKLEGPFTVKPPTDKAIAVAKLYPLGWVIAVDHYDGPSDRVPVERIVGFWKVNETGELIGDFIDNPKYRPIEDCN